MGEADYLLKGFPITEKEETWSILMLFSHHHVRSFAYKNKLSRYESIPDHTSIQTCRQTDYEKYPRMEWRRILNICLDLVTYPELLGYKHELVGYKEYQETIEEILEIVSNTSISSNPHDINARMDVVLSILQKYNMPKEIKVSPYKNLK